MKLKLFILSIIFCTPFILFGQINKTYPFQMGHSKSVMYSSNPGVQFTSYSDAQGNPGFIGQRDNSRIVAYRIQNNKIVEIVAATEDSYYSLINTLENSTKILIAAGFRLQNIEELHFILYNSNTKVWAEFEILPIRNGYAFRQRYYY